MTAHPHHPSTKLIFQSSINTLNSAALVIAHCFGHFMSDQPTTFIFSGHFIGFDQETGFGLFSFDSEGGVTALFGPSGAGKTSIINMIAGLLAPDRGRIVLKGEVLFDDAARIDLAVWRRRIGNPMAPVTMVGSGAAALTATCGTC